jgi:hypothetical protein
MSSVVAQKTRDGLHVLDEIVIRHATTGQACEEFLKRFPRHPAGVHVYGDASGNAQQTTGASDFTMVKEFFWAHTSVPVHYRVPSANPAVRERVNVMNGQFFSAGGRAGVFVDMRCKELIKDLEQVTYKAESMLIDKDRDRARTHLSDALGYLIWQECRPQPTVGERGEVFLP